MCEYRMQQKEIVRTVRGARQVSEMFKCYETKKKYRERENRRDSAFQIFFSIEKKRK